MMNKWWVVRNIPFGRACVIVIAGMRAANTIPLTMMVKPQLSESRGWFSFKASKGEAVVGYRKPLATQKMGRHRLSRRVNKMKRFLENHISSMEDIWISSETTKKINISIDYSCFSFCLRSIGVECKRVLYNH